MFISSLVTRAKLLTCRVIDCAFDTDSDPIVLLYAFAALASSAAEMVERHAGARAPAIRAEFEARTGSRWPAKPRLNVMVCPPVNGPGGDA
jgi:hypothetical protein